MGDLFTTPEQPQTPTEPTPPQAPQTPTEPTQQYAPPYQTPTAPYNSNGAYNNGGQQYTPPYTPTPTPPTQYTPTSTMDFKKHQKKKSNVGKIIFVGLICICIALSSLAIGLSMSDKDKNNMPSSDTPTGDFAENNGGAQADVEDSPYSFSEYSGKGAMTPEQIYQNVKDINVGLLVYSQKQKITEGSGIIVGEDKSGEYTYILTAAHVISDQGISVQIQFSDESEAEATIVGFDAKTDIGVVKVKKTGLKAAKFGNSDKLTVGQKIYAIGNPGGTEFFGSFTSGIISAIDRPVPSANSSYDLPCIQHNAAINPGNSGGALVNEYGQIIGLNSSKISSTDYEGMGFAVPSNTVLDIYNDLISYGYVSNRPKLGIMYTPISSDYSYLNFALKNGLPYGSVVIAQINEGSDLANKNVAVGDIIIAVNGKKLETTDILLDAIENGKVGDELTLTIYRANTNGSSGSSFDVKVMLVEDRGETATSSAEPETQVFDPFSYFEGFGY